MNKDLQEAIKIYATRPHKELSAFLLDKSKDDLIAMFNDLLTVYINDKNSSALREFITTAVAEYEHNKSKLGYNGFKQITVYGEQSTKVCEVKPKNINTYDILKYERKERSKPAVLNAGGNFTDYTWSRFDKHMNDNPNLLVSGFINGRLIYIFEFPFNIEPFVRNLRRQLEKKFPNRIRKEGDYLRSASFTYKDFIFDCHNKKKYLLQKEELLKYKKFFDSKFFKKLLEFANE
ncbi:MAG: hypothetical protein LBL71_03050 [Endomicrobium sp.]|jgi:hypothetical protein|nr:hypothetical protein [Endomicrobium sp.]